jgi:hypothetical protein
MTASPFKAAMRRAHAFARRDTVAKILIDALAAPQTTRSEPRPERRRANKRVPWRTVYGWQLSLVPDGLLGPDDKPTGFKLVKQFTHEADTIIETGAGRTARKYMVQPNCSLHACV